MNADPTQPNAARSYDYFLGGDHNYPVDQAAARQLERLAPELPQAARLYRYFVQWASRELAEAGFTCYLDFASGLPTEGYIHELVPPTARIIYNDINRETIAHAQEIVHGYSKSGASSQTCATQQRFSPRPTPSLVESDALVSVWSASPTFSPMRS